MRHSYRGRVGHIQATKTQSRTKSFPEHAIYPKEPAVVQGAAGALGGFQEQLEHQSGHSLSHNVSQIMSCSSIAIYTMVGWLTLPATHLRRLFNSWELHGPQMNSRELCITPGNSGDLHGTPLTSGELRGPPGTSGELHCTPPYLSSDCPHLNSEYPHLTSEYPNVSSEYPVVSSEYPCRGLCLIIHRTGVASPLDTGFRN